MDNLTPLTAAATFRITGLDVGTEAVRPGCMAEVEEGRHVLLSAAKIVLRRLREGHISIGAAHEAALENAIRVVEER